ncbi:MAG: ABC transporter permease [Deltaproteobacteria bacterium]|nr:ABC transporter permease [Deltaproteobacteria bacterium]
MRSLRIWAYHFRNAFSGIFRNRLVHAISVGTISISLLFLGAFALFLVNVNNWVLEWGKSLSLSIYLEDGMDTATRKRIEAALAALPGVTLRGFVSKEKAMADLKATLGSQAGLLDGLSRNPLPASFEVVFKDVRKGQIDPKKMKTDLEKIQGVSEVQYSEQVQERFEVIFSILKVAGLIIGLLLCMGVLFIITNTIRLTIYSRREEIEIYKLVGASDWFVKLPYLIEGALEGLFGGILALLILFSIYFLLSVKRLQVLGLPVLEVVFLPHSYTAFLAGLSLILGLAGSFIAIGRFFKN